MPFAFRHAQFCAGSSHCEGGGQEESCRQIDVGNNQVEDNHEAQDSKEERCYGKK